MFVFRTSHTGAATAVNLLEEVALPSLHQLKELVVSAKKEK